MSLVYYTMEMALNRFEETYKKERKSLLGYIRSKVSSIEEAEDILQDVFYQAVRHSNTTEPINNLMGWLYGVTKNKITDWYRKKKHSTVSLHEEIEEDLTLEDMIADSGIDVEKDFVKGLVFETIQERIKELPEKQRRVFIDREVNGLSYREIEEDTGIPVNTLLAQKRYANMYLQKCLHVIKETLEDFKEIANERSRAWQNIVDV